MDVVAFVSIGEVYRVATTSTTSVTTDSSPRTCSNTCENPMKDEKIVVPYGRSAVSANS